MGLKQQFKKLLLWAFVVTLSTALLKSAAIYFFHTASLVSDTIFSWIVAVSQGVLYFGMGRRDVPKSRENPFGYTGKLYFFAYISTLVLLSLGMFYFFLRGAGEIGHPHLQQIAPPWVTLLFYIPFLPLLLITARLFRFCTRLRGNNRLRLFFMKSKWVDLISVLFQLTALMAVMVLSGTSLLLHCAASWERASGAAAMGIGLIALGTVLAIGMKMEDLLIGESAESSVNHRIHGMLQKEEWIEDVTSLQTLQLDSESILLAVKARFNEHLSAGELRTLINGLEMDIRTAFPDIKHIFIETAPKFAQLQ